MKKKHVTLFIGSLLLVAGLVFWLDTLFDSPNAPQPAPVFSPVNLVTSEESAGQNELTNIADEKRDGAATAGRARVFTCTAYPELEVSGIISPEITIGNAPNVIKRQYWAPVEIEKSLKHSKDPEHLLMVALLGSGTTSKLGVSAMEKALAVDPDNLLTLWNFLDACSLHPEATVCANGSIEKRAILANGDNGLLWGKIADYRLERGDIAGAYGALIKATSAPWFNNYFIEHVEMLERGLAAATNYPYRKRITNAIGVAAAMPFMFYNVFQGCEEQAAGSAEWLQACIEYGKRLEHDGRTILSIGFGISLQRQMYEVAGDTTKIEQAVLRFRRIADTMESGYSDDGWVLLAYDDQVLADYMTEWSAHGELRAMQFVQEEVVRLSQQPGYDPCKLNEARKSATND